MKQNATIAPEAAQSVDANAITGLTNGATRAQHAIMVKEATSAMAAEAKAASEMSRVMVFSYIASIIATRLNTISPGISKMRVYCTRLVWYGVHIVK